MDDDEWYEPGIFYGFGSCHDLRDAEYKPSRLAQFNFKSVKNTTTVKPEPRLRRQPVGFRFPWRK